MTPAPPHRMALPAAVGAVVLWGLGPVLVASVDLPGISIAAHRTWIGACLLTGALYLRKGSLDWPRMRTAAMGGISFGLNIAFFFAAVKSTSVTNATLISALQPALLLLVASRRFGERVGLVDVVWTALALGGVALVVVSRPAGGHAALTGDLLAVAALITWAWYFVASKRARATLGALEYQAALLVWAAVVVAPVAVVSGERLAPAGAGTWVGIVAIAVGPGSGHLMMNWAHGHVDLSLASLLTLLNPVITVAAAAVFLDERIVALQVVGIAVVLASLAPLVTRRRAPRGEPVAPAASA